MSWRTLSAAALAAGLGVSVAACTADQVQPIIPNPMTPTDPQNPQQPMDPMKPMDPMTPAGPTFHRDIEPLLQDRCQTCHREDGIAPFPLITITDVVQHAAQIVNETSARRMPPWGAVETDECKPRYSFAGDQHLTQDQIELLAGWVRSGMAEGDPNDAPPPRHFSDQDGELTRIDDSLQPKTGWTVSGARDQFRCFVIDPHWTQQQWITGVHFKPGNPRIVHHAIAFLDPNGESLGRQGADGGYECFAGPNIQNTSVLTAWAPGVPAGEFPDGVAMQMEARSLIVLQVHYHALGNDGESDLSTLELEYGNVRPRYLMQILLIGNFDGPIGGGDGLLPDPDDRGQPEFVIPAGATHHVETELFTLPETLGPQAGNARIPDLKVLAVATHMHYVGFDMKFDIEHAQPKAGEPEKECMIHVPHWDFRWQRSYTYDVAIEDAPEWRPHDRLNMRCIYDNSMSNPFVVQALGEQGLTQPREVRLGEQTLDEMCLSVMAIAYVNPF